MKYLKLFEEAIPHRGENCYYHGTNLDIPRLRVPMWLTTDIFLAAHFALNSQGGRIISDVGFVYKIRYVGNKLERVDNGNDKRRFILNDENFEIVSKFKVDKLLGSVPYKITQIS